MEAQRRFPYRFFVVTFLWSWIIWLPLVLAGMGIVPLSKDLQTQLGLPVLIVAAFGPAVGAFYSLKTLDGKGAIIRYLRGLFDFRVGWKAWLVPIIVAGGSSVAAWKLPELFGAPGLGTRWSFLVHSPIFLVIIGLFAGSQEELGWRGYILDPMEERFGPWLGNLLLGIVWALWHLPLFLIPGNSQPFIPALGFLVLTIGYSWFLAWLRAASGKRLSSGIYGHGLLNIFGTIFPTVTNASGASQVRYWIWSGMFFVIGLVAMALRVAKSRQSSPAARAKAQAS